MRISLWLSKWFAVSMLINLWVNLYIKFSLAFFLLDSRLSHPKSEILKEQFSSVFTEENLDNIPDVGKTPTLSMSSIKITVNGVIKQLKSLKPNKACGPDEIPPWFFKENVEEISPVLTNIFQDSIDSGIVPSKWKKENLILQTIDQFH